MTPDGDCSPDRCGASNNSGGQSPGGERNCQELRREDGAPPAAGVAEVSRSTVTQPTGRANGLTCVYAVDLVRVLIFACVIAAHTTASVNSLDSVSAGGAAMLLHFTPETFFALTAFVLVYPYRDALAASLRADRGALRHLDHDLHRAGTDHGAAATDRSTDPTRDQRTRRRLTVSNPISFV